MIMGLMFAEETTWEEPLSVPELRLDLAPCFLSCDLILWLVLNVWLILGLTVCALDLGERSTLGGVLLARLCILDGCVETASTF